MIVPLARKSTEQDVQRGVKQLFALAGFAIYDTSQGYRKEKGGTRMTPGLSDLVLFHERLKRSGFFEVKTVEGLAIHHRGLLGQGRSKDVARAKAQHRFGELCLATGVFHGIGGMAEAYQLLESLGLAEREPTSISGYRIRVSRATPNPTIR